MKKCRKVMNLARDGVRRGFCTSVINHRGGCGNGTCGDCGVVLSEESASSATISRGSGTCTQCNSQIHEVGRRAHGQKAKVYQRPGKRFIFPCGCEGLLPKH